MNEDYENHWMFNSVENKVLRRMNNKLDDVENYLYSNKNKIPKEVYDDMLDILWRRK